MSTNLNVEIKKEPDLDADLIKDELIGPEDLQQLVVFAEKAYHDTIKEECDLDKTETTCSYNRIVFETDLDNDFLEAEKEMTNAKPKLITKDVIAYSKTKNLSNIAKQKSIEQNKIHTNNSYVVTATDTPPSGVIEQFNNNLLETRNIIPQNCDFDKTENSHLYNIIRSQNLENSTKKIITYSKKENCVGAKRSLIEQNKTLDNNVNRDTSTNITQNDVDIKEELIEPKIEDSGITEPNRKEGFIVTLDKTASIFKRVTDNTLVQHTILNEKIKEEIKDHETQEFADDIKIVSDGMGTETIVISSDDDCDEAKAKPISEFYCKPCDNYFCTQSVLTLHSQFHCRVQLCSCNVCSKQSTPSVVHETKNPETPEAKLTSRNIAKTCLPKQYLVNKERIQRQETENDGSNTHRTEESNGNIPSNVSYPNKTILNTSYPKQHIDNKERIQRQETEQYGLNMFTNFENNGNIVVNNFSNPNNTIPNTYLPMQYIVNQETMQRQTENGGLNMCTNVENNGNIVVNNFSKPDNTIPNTYLPRQYIVNRETIQRQTENRGLNMYTNVENNGYIDVNNFSNPNNTIPNTYLPSQYIVNQETIQMQTDNRGLNLYTNEGNGNKSVNNFSNSNRTASHTSVPTQSFVNKEWIQRQENKNGNLNIITSSENNANIPVNNFSNPRTILKTSLSKHYIINKEKIQMVKNFNNNGSRAVNNSNRTIIHFPKQNIVNKEKQETEKGGLNMFTIGGSNQNFHIPLKNSNGATNAIGITRKPSNKKTLTQILETKKQALPKFNLLGNFKIPKKDVIKMKVNTALGAVKTPPFRNISTKKSSPSLAAYKNATINLIDLPEQDDFEIETDSTQEAIKGPVSRKKNPSVLTRPSPAKDFSCSICKSKFLESAKLINHMQEMHKIDTQPTCNICSKKFAAVKYLKRHMETHNNELKYQCDQCEKIYKSKMTLAAHQQYFCKNKTCLDPFTCEVCHKEYGSKTTLMNHKKHYCYDKTGDMPFSCDVCHKKFPELRILNFHKKKHCMKAYKFICDYCQKRFTCKYYLVRHMYKHTGVTEFRCKICNKGFPRKERMIFHEKLHFGLRPHVCDNCDKGFVKVDHLARHKKMVCNEKTFKEKPFVCDICKKRFKDKKGITVHITKNHAKTFFCDICKKVFGQSYLLEPHYKRHGYDNKISCSVCNKNLRGALPLIKHERKHPENARSFSCNKCHRKYIHSYSWMYHKTRCAKNKREKSNKHICDICQKTFINNATLKYHKETTCDAKTIKRRPLLCDYCKKRFARKAAIARHITMNHSKTFPCEICEKQFGNKYALEYHLRRHESKRISCDLCPKKFVEIVDLVVHEQCHSEKKFSCMTCGRKFVHKMSIIYHKEYECQRVNSLNKKALRSGKTVLSK